MRFRGLLLFVVIFTICCMFGQYDSYNVDFVTQMSGFRFYRSINGYEDRVFVATGNMITFYRLNYFDDLVKTNKYLLKYNVSEIEVKDSLAFITCEEYMLYIFDISNPDTMNLISSFETWEGYSIEFIDDSYLLLSGTYHSTIIDYSDINHLEQISYFLHYGETDVTISNNHAIGINDTRMDIADISDPYDPRLQNTTIFEENLISVESKDDVVYVTDFYDNMYIIDISDPSAPVFVDTISSDFCHELNIDGDYLFASGENLTILDISEPLAPVTVARTYDHAVDAYDIHIESDKLYLLSSDEVIQYDISDIYTPTYEFNTQFQVLIQDFEVIGDYVYTYYDYSTTQNNLIDLTTPITPSVSSLDIEGELLGRFENILYYEDGSSIHAYRVLDGYSPEYLGYTYSGRVGRMAVNGEKAIVTSSGGLKLFSLVTRDSVPDLEYTSEETVYSINSILPWHDNDFLAETNTDILLHIEITDSNTLSFSHEYEFEHDIDVFTICDDLVLIHCGEDSILFYNLEDPDTNVLVSVYQPYWDVTDIYALEMIDNYLIINGAESYEDYGIYIMDISDLDRIQMMGYVFGESMYLRLKKVFDNKMYCTLSSEGFVVFDINAFISSVSAPQTQTPENINISTYPNPFNSTLNIELPNNASSVNIYDVLGNQVFWAETQNKSSISWQPDKSLNSGIYLVKINTDENTFVTKTIYVK